EIGLAVVATTFSIVAVFLPVGLMPGISGQFFKNFGFTVVISVLISLAVARMITPLAAAYFLEHHGEQKHGEGWLMDRYMGLLRWSLGHRFWMMLMGLGAFGLTVVLLFTMPQQFQPNQDNDFSRINIEMVPGTTLRQTEVVADRVGALISSQPEVEMAMETVQEGNARIFITLKPDRQRSSTEFERASAPRPAPVPDARATS